MITHDVFNQTPPLADFNPFLADIARHLPATGPGPVIHAVPVPALAYDGMIVEIEAIAMKGANGKRLERQMNYRYNRQMRVYLPGFAAKWACLTAVFFGIGFALAGLAAPELLTAFLFATGVSALTVAVVVVTAWCWLTRFPELY